MEIKKLLPIGSVVLLKEGQKRLMIFGVKQTNTDGQAIEYDYIGVMYPEGFMGGDNQYLFYHKDIDSVVFTGFEDDERTQFLDRLSQYYGEDPGKSSEQSFE